MTGILKMLVIFRQNKSPLDIFQAGFLIFFEQWR